MGTKHVLFRHRPPEASEPPPLGAFGQWRSSSPRRLHSRRRAVPPAPFGPRRVVLSGTALRLVLRACCVPGTTAYAGEVTLSLQTDRLLIRDWEEDDADAALEIYGSADVAPWLSPAIEQVPDATSMRLLLQAWIEAQPNFVLPAGRWAVARRDDGEVVGALVIRLLPPYEEDLEIGWQLRPSAWGHGYATEASRELMRWAFKEGASTNCSPSPARTTSARSPRRAASACSGSARRTSTTT